MFNLAFRLVIQLQLTKIKADWRLGVNAHNPQVDKEKSQPHSRGGLKHLVVWLIVKKINRLFHCIIYNIGVVFIYVNFIIIDLKKLMAN